MPGRTIYVHAHLDDDAKPMGELRAEVVKGREVFSFTYDPTWLARPHVQQLDPGLQAFSGPQYPPPERSNFGLFLDSAPDRWGRTLLQRHEAQLARSEQRPVRNLLESDMLLAVDDTARMGALRFALSTEGPYLNHDARWSIPPMTRLRELQQASLALEDPDDGEDDVHWLALLLAPGSSLGGARPKASVTDEHNNLWIAKFPSRSDNVDKGAWEAVTHALAQRCGITVPVAKAERFGTQGHTFLSQRFDRTTSGGRIHYASAMTLLGRNDGDGANNGTSYLELAEFIMRHGANANADLEQLWKRIVFSVRVRNTDDHLRNHGFLLLPEGWCLAPAFDMNPEPLGRGLSLNIDEHDNALSMDLALSVAPLFRVDPTKATAIVADIQAKVAANWRPLAKSLGLDRRQVDVMALAFWE